ncbi:hypothetical protein DP939_30115 [Spongiactinospora rosea]|uniref:Protein kinase domain-containing protein n=1 Tax=Spongiactinospora rosea TaxID=2248750 RepID=A0A366LRM6_9ACTN|nr:serine/threonine-protein kinase [Spongiactinospora rosea]RBQ16566.1 hypothetical protein DP939_30115 [Spongiactinospora rosea]
MPQIEPLITGDPSRLGSYRLAGRVGEGGQGVVYLGVAEDGEQAAIKLLHVRFSGDTSARSRFARELRAAQRVASFCTARVLEADLEGDVPYIASEYIEGRSLRERIDTEGPIRGSALERLAVGTATALTAIHHAAIVHRDFKPDNVLLAADGPRVVDFGIARIIDSTGTITSKAIGTPAYMAPEQISGDDVGPYTDVFAWGATIAFAATGVTVFEGSSIAVVLNRVLNHEVDLGVMDEPLRGVVRSALDKSPRNRPTSDQLLLRLLGRPESGDASPAVLDQGVRRAAPGAGSTQEAADSETTRQRRLPGAPQNRPTGPGPSPTPARTDTNHPLSGRPRPPSGPTPPPFDRPAAQPSGAGHPPPPWSRHTPVPPPGQTGPGGPMPAPPLMGSPIPTPPAVHDGRTRPVHNRRFPAKATVVTLAAVLFIALLGLLAWMGLLPSFFGSPAESGESTGGVRKAETAADSVLNWAEGTEPFTVGVRDGLPGIALNSGKGGKPIWAGFEVDLAREIARALGVSSRRLTFQATDRAQRPALLAEGDVDMVLSTYAINKVDEVTFAGPYYLAHIDVLVKDGSSISTVADLEGKRLCQPGAGFAVKAVQRVVDRIKLVPVADYSQCMDRLRAGRVDAVPGDDLLLAGFANREKLRYKVVGLKLSTERYGVALRAGDVRGCQAVQKAITALYRDGTVKALLTRHFGNVEFAAETAIPRMQPCR